MSMGAESLPKGECRQSFRILLSSMRRAQTNLQPEAGISRACIRRVGRDGWDVSTGTRERERVDWDRADEERGAGSVQREAAEDDWEPAKAGS
eukprot:1224415-Rhodomonas_salina.1